MKPRIGLHCPGTGSGGPWRYVHSLLRHIDLTAFDVRVFCDIEGLYEPRPEILIVPLQTRSNQRPDAFYAGITSRQASGILSPQRQFQMLPRSFRLIAGFFRDARRLARTLRPHRLDLFHTQNTGCEEAPVAARLAGIGRIVGTFHTDSTYDLNRERDSWDYRMLERISNRSLHRAIAVSHATGRDWRRRTFMPPHRVVAIHNGIDASQFSRRQSQQDARRSLNVPEEAFVVAGLGRLDQAKGFADLIDAAAMAEVPNLLLLIAGTGPLQPALEAHAASRGVTVRFLGFLSDVQPVLDAADLFALPSLCEACPYAVLEAMAAGLPVLGSDVGGVSELIAAGAGLVLPPRAPAAWAPVIRALAKDATLRARFGAAGRDRVALFDEREMAARTFQIYRELLG